MSERSGAQRAVARLLGRSGPEVRADSAGRSRLATTAGSLALAAFAALALTAGAALAQAPPPQGFPGEAPPGPPAEILSFTADAESLRAGMPLTLRWAAINAYTLDISPGIGTVATRGSRTVFPQAATIYTLTVTGTGGTKVASVSVNVTGGGVAAPVASTKTVPDAAPRLVDGTPDLSGVYLGGRDIRLVAPPRLRPGAESYRVPQSDEDLGQGALCLPPGVPAATMVPYPLQLVHKPDVLVILYEAYNLFRIVPIDRDHPEDVDPTWMGNSVAYWDGDTLVVDVTGFNDKTRVAGFRHTTDMHVIERYRMNDAGQIEYEASVEDPNVFAEPVRYAGNLVPHPEWEIGEYVCAENNKDYAELFED